MRIMRIGDRDNEIPVVEHNGQHFDVSGVVTDIDPSFWAHGPAKVSLAIEDGTAPTIDISEQRIGAPIVRPSAVICIGQNYVEHAAESGDLAPTQPIVFLKTPNTITGPYDPIGIPPRAQKFDWEVELGVVIGAQVSYLSSKDEALAAIGGYVVANDLSERDYQSAHSGGQWSKGKCVKDSMPLGPYLVNADSLDPHDLQLASWVNNEPRQDSTTADMIFSTLR